uniref:Uncharacterized protein n=1 Tax=Panagrolaimus superbus TaxID=310955 RepID=A0A914Y0P5_9BILA
MQAEAKRIEAAIPAQAMRIALDERGKDLTTVKLAQELERWRSSGQDIAILVGGPDGLDAALKQSCHGMLRLSSLTLPHPLVTYLSGRATVSRLPIYLASASPRRHDLLNSIQITHEVLHVPSPPGEDEPRLEQEAVLDYVRRTARDKLLRALEWRAQDSSLDQERAI